MKQKDRNRVLQYLNAPFRSLFDAYNSPSKIKREIWEDIKLSCHADNGHFLKLVSANTHRFSAGYLFEKNGEEYLKFFTATETIIIPMSPVRKELDNV